MPKARRTFVCSGCGATFPAHAGKCNRCGEWNTIEEAFIPEARTGAAALRLASVVTLAGEDEGEPDSRMPTGIDEFDRVLGGGLVAGSVVVIGGEPGIGKSTLMLQAAALLAGRGNRVAYLCGEESPRQVRMRAGRLGLRGAAVSLIAETALEPALAAAMELGADVLVVDSVQTVFVEDLDSRAGGTAQLAEVGSRLVSWAKANEVTVLVTGHVTKAGEIAGPKVLEHLVDVVLSFEAAESGAVRVLRAVKNRFGATDEVGVFEMTGEGLAGLANPSDAFRSDPSDQAASGCAATVVFEGSRPLIIEVQALAVPTSLAVPRRVASGMDVSRLHVLLAVLARRAGIAATNLDVVVSVAGGLRLRDPATDLAVLAALASAVTDRPLPLRMAFIGEVALSGSVRQATQLQRRLTELARAGYGVCVTRTGSHEVEGITVQEAHSVREALLHAREAGGQV